MNGKFLTSYKSSFLNATSTFIEEKRRTYLIVPSTSLLN